MTDESFGRIRTTETDKYGITHNLTHLVLFRMVSIVQHGKVIDIRTENVKYRDIKY